MKIAVIGYIGWYGSIAEWVADGFEDNGHEVIRIDRKEIGKYKKSVDGALCTFGQDFVVYVDCSEDYSNEMPLYLCGASSIIEPQIFWSLDAHMPGGAERSVNIARKCDLTFSTNYEYGVKILEKFGVESILMPVTYSDRLIGESVSNDSSWEFEDNFITMIGHPNSPERIKLWDLLHTVLKGENYDFLAFTGKAETEELYSAAMNCCDIVVNQPTEPWDNILNNRFFEGLGSGKLLLQKELKTDLIEKLGFVDGQDFVYWKTFDELKEKIKYYWRNRDEMKTISESGQEKVQQYSMKAQCAKIESIVLSKFYDRL